MSDVLPDNAKAILLLTAPLIVGRAKASPDLLSPAEYKKMAVRLRELGRQPADLLASNNRLLADLAPVVGEDRLKRLLARGFLLSQAIERWHARAIWVASRADATYPQAIKHRLKEDAPAVLYGCGARSFLDSGGLAIVGSRNTTESLIGYTMSIGRLAASARVTVVSGGARGVDQAAMRAALDAGGKVVGVLADSLENAAMNREHRRFLLDGQLVLLSPYDPSAGFNVGHAMQRNKLIYAFSDAALVVDAQKNKGGTWAGATEQLTKLRLVPIYVRSTQAASSGLDALIEMGARRWPNPEDREALIGALAIPSAPVAVPVVSEPTPLPFNAQGDAEVAGGDTVASEPSFDAAAELFRTVGALVLRILRNATTADEVARALAVTKRQAEDWLTRLVADGLVERHSRPTRYSARQPTLFEADVKPRGRANRNRARKSSQLNSGPHVFPSTGERKSGKG
jgi:predicted Rossmann fold nucleotide-binding protein DprA/Smf involved in DNA uptake